MIKNCHLLQILIQEIMNFYSGENQIKKERILRLLIQRFRDSFYDLKVSNKEYKKLKICEVELFLSFYLSCYILFFLLLDCLRIVTWRDYQTWYKNVKHFIQSSKPIHFIIVICLVILCVKRKCIVIMFISPTESLAVYTTCTKK